MPVLDRRFDGEMTLVAVAAVVGPSVGIARLIRHRASTLRALAFVGNQLRDAEPGYAVVVVADHVGLHSWRSLAAALWSRVGVPRQVQCTQIGTHSPS